MTSIAYEDSVREALCFGWIDSLIKRLDDERYARKFTPRKPTSNESIALLAAGKKLGLEVNSNYSVLTFRNN